MLFLCGCDSPQSALAPASLEAAHTAVLFWSMAAGAAATWLLVLALAGHAACRRRPASEARARRLMIAGGLVLPAALLLALLVLGLSPMPRATAPADALRVQLSGERWWWRVRYEPSGAEAIELANELRLPLGMPVELVMSSPEVIHSLWIPPLAGKLDLIPGRITRLVLQADRVGRYRGVCAEYCGIGHAWMGVEVVVSPPGEFARWLAQQAASARVPQSEQAQRGRALFLRSGCDACHTIRGTAARGVVGPDLTHVGSRARLGAGVLPVDADSLRRWIAETARLKPGVLMPSFDMLDDGEQRAIASYLSELR